MVDKSTDDAFNSLFSDILGHNDDKYIEFTEKLEKLNKDLTTLQESVNAESIAELDSLDGLDFMIGIAKFNFDGYDKQINLIKEFLKDVPQTDNSPFASTISEAVFEYKKILEKCEYRKRLELRQMALIESFKNYIDKKFEESRQ